eukprot:UN15520
MICVWGLLKMYDVKTLASDIHDFMIANPISWVLGKEVSLLLANFRETCIVVVRWKDESMNGVYR